MLPPCSGEHDERQVDSTDPHPCCVMVCLTNHPGVSIMSDDQPRYKDSSQTVDVRVEDLLGRMTLDEKIAQLGCLWSTALISQGRFDTDFAAAKMPHGIGQITRIGASTGLRPRESAELMNAIQKVAVERTRLGIP